MQTPEIVKAQIREAFAEVRYPGDNLLRGSDESDEPFAVERDFRGKRDWRALSPQFIDRSPDGLASALSFFSHEAFRFFIAAYLIADIDGQLESSDPVFYLVHGLEHRSARKCINPKRFGEKTWSDFARERFSAFTTEESAAVVAYLTFKRGCSGVRTSTFREIDEALESYWKARAA